MFRIILVVVFLFDLTIVDRRRTFVQQAFVQGCQSTVLPPVNMPFKDSVPVLQTLWPFDSAIFVETFALLTLHLNKFPLDKYPATGLGQSQ